VRTSLKPLIDMKRIIIITIFLMIISCKEKEQGASSIYSHTVVNEVLLNESQQRLANIYTLKINEASMEANLVVNAVLATNTELSEIVSSRISGRLERVYFKETGRRVQKGQPLYEIYSEQLLTLQNEFLLTKVQYESSSSNKRRYEDYYNAARKKLLLIGLSETQINDLSESKVAQSKFAFLSPASGIIKTIYAIEGQYVNEGDVLFELENTQHLWVEAEVYPEELNQIEMGDEVQVQVAGFENDPVKSKVIFISPEYIKGSQIIKVRVSILNEKGQYISGMQAQVFFNRKVNSRMQVPVDAVIRDETGAFVFIKVDENKFIPRMVKTGNENFNNIEIKEGIEPGDLVVISGAYLLYSDLILKIGTSSLTHNHQ
jgi:Cu(I)/Ag(I) efflux system membrane fusion protein